MDLADERMNNLLAKAEAAVQWLGRDSTTAIAFVEELVVPELGEVLGEVASQLDKDHRLDHSGKSETTFVVHYTGVRTIINLLKSAGNLRLYDSAHFNDPDEGNQLFQTLNADLELAWLMEHAPSHAYIASFVADDPSRDSGDQLSFWRTYGREGEGCSLRVKVPDSLLRRVKYRPEDVQLAANRIKPALVAVNDLAFHGQLEERRRLREILADTIRKSLGGILYLYKGESYDHEEELRIVLAGDNINEDAISFEHVPSRLSEGHLRHYQNHPDLEIRAMARDSGSQITLGPRILRPDDVKNSLEILVKRAGLGNSLQVRVSKIPPYRVIG